MNLYKKTVDKYLLDTLIKLQNIDLFKDFYLVGGTALSLQIGHRVSEDIDLFCQNGFDKNKIYNYFVNNITKNVEIINDGNDIFQIMLDNRLKIDFVHYPFKVIEPLLQFKSGLKMVGKNDISAMKISAVATRGNEAKDFVDIYYLLKDISIEKMFDNFKKKYETNDIQHYKRSIVYFDSVPKESWLSIKMITDKLTVANIKKTLIKAVKDYDKKILLDNKPKYIDNKTSLKKYQR